MKYAYLGYAWIRNPHNKNYVEKVVFHVFSSEKNAETWLKFKNSERGRDEFTDILLYGYDKEPILNRNDELIQWIESELRKGV